MAQFRMLIRGKAGPASRLGTKKTGMHATLQSYEGQVNVRMFHHDGDRSHDAGDYVRITLSPHGEDVTNGVLLYEGPCDGWRSLLASHAVRISNKV